MAFYTSIKDNRKHWLYIPFILLTILLNGKTGLLIFLFGVIVLFIYFICTKTYRKKVVSLGFVLVGVVLLSLGFLKVIKPNTYGLFRNAIKDTISLVFKGEKNGNFNILANDFNLLNDCNLIIGEGYRIYNEDSYPNSIEYVGKHSDVGYINDLYMGGIIFVLMLYIPFFVYFNYKNVSNSSRVLFIIFSLIVLIVNVKGEAFRASVIIDIIVLLKLIYIDSYYNNLSKKVSVVMATHNTPLNYFKNAINSILNQNHRNLELIIICDGSYEDYSFVKKNYNDKRIILYKNKTNMGLPASLNKALNFATGDYIARMDSDDIATLNRLENQVDYMENNPDIMISGMFAQMFGDSTGIKDLFFNSKEDISAQLLYRACLVHPTVIMKKDYIKNNNIRYNEDFLCSQDYELWSRINNSNIGILPYVGLYYRVHEKQASESKKLIQMEMSKMIIEQNSLRIGLTTDEILNTLMILAGRSELTINNYIEVSNDIDKIINNNFYYKNTNLKRCLYNRYFHLLLKNRILIEEYKNIISNSSVLKKVVRFYNVLYIFNILLNKIFYRRKIYD